MSKGKIQVETENVEAGVRILKSLGYILEKEETGKTFLDKIYDFTEKIPLLKNIIPQMRLLILVGVALLCVLIPYFF